MLLNEALLEAKARGREPYSVLRVPYVTRGLELGTGIYARAMRLTAAGQVTQVTKPGGWSPIHYGFRMEDSDSKRLKIVETKVSVLDPDGELLEMLETYDPRGSEAMIDVAAPGLVLADWQAQFRGIFADYARDEPATDLLLKTDDSLLRVPVPAGTILRTQWGSAEEGSIFGTYYHLVMGIQDSWQITARGMVRAPNIRYDENFGYWYLASVDRMVNIRRIAFDGIPQGDNGWQVRRQVEGQHLLTIIEILPGFQPSKGVVVSFDCEGPDADGLDDGDSLTGAPDILRAIINEYVARDAPLRGWRGDSNLIHAPSWDAASEYFALRNVEAARTFGGEQEPETLTDVIDSFHEAYRHVGIFWNEAGQLQFGILDPDDVDPDFEARLDLKAHHEGGRVPFANGDRKEVYSHIHMPIIYSSGEQKFLSAYDAHDVAALPKKAELPIDNIWSQGRLTQDTDLNPLPPPDPEPPS